METQLMKSETVMTAGIFHNICIVLIPQMDEGRSELLIVGSPNGAASTLFNLLLYLS